MKASHRLIALLSLGSWAVQAAASMPVPDTINYQGRLKTTGGSPVADGSYSVIFRLYDDPSTGANVWSEFYNGPSYVTTVNGLFNVSLGSLTPIPASIFNQALWLQIEWYNPLIFSWEVLSPRHALTAAPYAYTAKSLQAPAQIIGALAHPGYSLSVSQTVSFNGGGAISAHSPASATATIYALNTDGTMPGPSNYPGMGIYGEGPIGIYGRAYFDNGVGVMGSVPNGAGANGAALVGLNNASGLGIYVESKNSGGKAIEAWGDSQGVSVTALSGPALMAFSNAGTNGAEIRNTGSGQALYLETLGDGGVMTARMTNISNGVAAILGQDASGTSGYYDIAGVQGASTGNVGVLGGTSTGAGVYGGANGAGGKGVVANGFSMGLSATASDTGAGVAIYGAGRQAALFMSSNTLAGSSLTAVSVSAQNTGASGGNNATGLSVTAFVSSPSGSNATGIYVRANSASAANTIGLLADASPGSGGIGIRGIGGNSAFPNAGVLGEISSTATSADGRAGIRALNNASAVTAGSPAIALDVDGGISLKTTRPDPIAGQVTVNVSTGATTTNAAIRYGTAAIASNQIKGSSLIYLTAEYNPGSPDFAQCTCFVQSKGAGNAVVMCQLQSNNATQQTGTVTVNYLIINTR